MPREHRAGTKAVIILIAVVLLSALLAYFLHFRPAAETVPTPEEVGPRPEEVRGTPGERRAAP
jgi:hypothetical protein